MQEAGSKKQDETGVLDAVDLATMTEDRICITRDHENGTLAWRIASPKADPLGLMLRVLVMQVLHDNSIFERIEALEKRVAELEGGSKGDSRIAPTLGA